MVFAGRITDVMKLRGVVPASALRAFIELHAAVILPEGQATRPQSRLWGGGVCLLFPAGQEGRDGSSDLPQGSRKAPPLPDELLHYGLTNCGSRRPHSHVDVWPRALIQRGAGHYNQLEQIGVFIFYLFTFNSHHLFKRSGRHIRGVLGVGRSAGRAVSSGGGWCGARRRSSRVCERCSQ